MRLEVARMVADWLADATDGVAAKLALLPLDGSDTRPSTTLSVVDETRSFTAALGRADGLDLPALLVGVEEIEHRDPELAVYTDRADALVSVVIRYAERTEDAALAVTNGAYVLRAVLASLRAFHKAENENTARTRNSVRIVSCEGLSETSDYQAAEDAWLLGAVRVRYYVSNLLPMGA